MRPLLVTNFCSHYRAPLFELLQSQLGIEFVFYSAGEEDYWQRHLGTTRGGFTSQTIRGREVMTKIRVNPALLRELLVRDYDVLIKCMNGRLELPTAYLAARIRRKPFILWTSLWTHPTTPFHRLSKYGMRWLYGHADAIITDGIHVSRFVEREGAESAKVFAAELAVDNEMFTRPVPAQKADGFRKAAGATGRPLVLSVARLTQQKGLDGLVRAIAALDDINPVLAVVGTGDRGPELRALARSLGVDLYLPGGVQPTDMPPIYRAADVFVLSSVTTPLLTEVWGLAVNEAMCSGLPVVTTDAVGAAAGGLVVNGVTGLVVPERDDRALAAALRRILASGELAGSLVENAKERVSRTTYDAMVAQYKAALDYVAARRG